MEVIAEGVETADQVAKLRALGCQYGQGYYFSKALNAEKAVRLLSEDSPEILPTSTGFIEYENTLIA
jgi:EAL domain-containing protein (putative c-di-GMP-specific phosphodiesterase class I)